MELPPHLNHAVAESYRAILVDGQLRWRYKVPDAIRHGRDEVRVRVRIEEVEEEDEDELGPLIDALAEADPYSSIDDPVDWQRRLRAESDVD